jgi:wobble nucleotide-excising tRNase
MITKIKLNCVASYKNPALLETDKKVNLIYGLNGTGKSIFSNYLYEKDHDDFSNCTIEGLNGEEIIVYNQKFIEDYFYESDNLKGIFTLSKENKEAEEKIRNAQKEIKKLDNEKLDKSDNLETIKGGLLKKKQNAENKVWEIKTRFTGGDRVLEFCLDGLKGKKETLLNYILDADKPLKKPDKSTNELKKEVEALKGESAQRYSTIPTINFTEDQIETNLLFQKEIIGNENSTVAELIKKLKNSDWVKKGLEFLPDEIDDTGKQCPFCQEKTITKTVVNNIKDYFDESYEKDLNEIERMFVDYGNAVNSLPSKESYNSYPLIKENQTDFDNKYNAVIRILGDNKKKIEDKQRTPSKKITIVNSAETIKNLNLYVADINKKINEHNQKIDNKEESIKQIKMIFWNIMRWDYDQTLTTYLKEKKDAEKKIADTSQKISTIEKSIKMQNETIREQQKNTVNIEKAITSINNGLTDLGLDDFRIEKHSENLYKIVRGSQDSDTFQTLSEGEKMIISFLYFIELCRGKKSATDVGRKKIIVIDDPISSLSHIFIFNIGQLIKKEFLFSDTYEQTFVLTHSLYFFYELADPKHERRKETQKLFRMTKNCDGSQILDMKYEEIQNDYHSYWQIVKDDKQAPALIANCIRNIIEYFFNFIEKKDLNNVFQKPVFQKNKYQAFCRYINRESHSLGQNIFDYKEFNYDDFKEALGLVFQKSGYKEHYEEMIK